MSQENIWLDAGDICAPHANFDASVTKCNYRVCTFSGGNQDRPMWRLSIFCQNSRRAWIEGRSNLTEVLGNQPGFLFKSKYNEVN